MLAAIALCVVTTILVKSGKTRHLWVTALPLCWLLIVTTTAAFQKLFNPAPRVGFLAHARDLADKLAAGTLPPELAAQVPRLVFNDRLNAGLTLLLMCLAWILVFDMVRVCLRHWRGQVVAPSSEVPYVRSLHATV